MREDLAKKTGLTEARVQVSHDIGVSELHKIILFDGFQGFKLAKSPAGVDFPGSLFLFSFYIHTGFLCCFLNCIKLVDLSLEICQMSGRVCIVFSISLSFALAHHNTVYRVNRNL